MLSVLFAATRGGSLTTKLVLQSGGDLVKLQAVEALASTALALLGGVAADTVPRRLLMPVTNGFLFAITLALAFGGDPTGFYAAYCLANPLSWVPLQTWFNQVKGAERWPTRLRDSLGNSMALIAPFVAQKLYEVFGRTVIVLDAASFLLLAVASAVMPQMPREAERRLDFRAAWVYFTHDKRNVVLWMIHNAVFAFSDVITAFNYKEAHFLSWYLTLEMLGRVVSMLTVISRSGEGSRAILFQQSLQNTILMGALLPLSCNELPVQVMAIHSFLVGTAAGTAWFGVYELMLGEAPTEIAGVTNALNRLGFSVIVLGVKASLLLVPTAFASFYFRQIAGGVFVVSFVCLIVLAIHSTLRPK